MIKQKITNWAIVQRFEGTLASPGYWQSVLKEDGFVYVDRQGKLSERYGDAEDALAAMHIAEAAAANGELTLHSSFGSDVPCAAWRIWMGLPWAEKNRIMGINSAAKAERKPAFPGWSAVELPADWYAQAQCVYEGDIAASMAAWAGKQWKNVPEMPAMMVDVLAEEFNRLAGVARAEQAAIAEASRNGLGSGFDTDADICGGEYSKVD
jgi:hypothetical protein